MSAPPATYPGADAVSDFLKSIDSIKRTECTINANVDKTCSVSNFDIQNCKNFNITCCNVGKVDITTCSAGIIIDTAKKSVKDAINKYPGLLKYIQTYINKYIADNGLSPAQAFEDGLTTYLLHECSDLTMVSQNASIPSLQALDCSNVYLNLYNLSDINIKCAAGAISAIFPSTVPPDGTDTNNYTSFSTDGIITMLTIGGAALIFMAVFIALRSNRV